MLTRWQPNCAPMLYSPRYCRAWCGLSVHPPAWLSEYWCVSEQGKAAFDCIVDLVLVSVLSPLTPKGSLSWFCVQSLSWFQWQWDISQGPLNTLALSRLSPVFNFLFVIDVSLHMHPGLINLPWYIALALMHIWKGFLCSLLAEAVPLLSTGQPSWELLEWPLGTDGEHRAS